MSKPITKAIITTLNNLPNLRESIAILRDEPCDQVIVVNNGSVDGTQEWLADQLDLTVINRENHGAGPGRNAGLDAAGNFDYVLMLDGGIRPLRGGIKKLVHYLERTPEADVIGIEIADFETDKERAWRRWPNPVEYTYTNTRLSHTAYCLCRSCAWNDCRFSEEGPFGEPGWGVDDDEMAYRWQEAGIEVHVVTCQCRQHQKCTGVHPYRHKSGSFQQLYRDTGIWPTQYGSVYEKRLVKLWQDWPQYEPGGNGTGAQWGEPWLTVVVKATSVETTARIIRLAHNLLRLRRFDKPFDRVPNPYSIILWDPSQNCDTWARLRQYRQHHGDTIILDEYGKDRKIIKRKERDETWTGDFRIWTKGDWRNAIRPGAFYYGLVENTNDLSQLVNLYNETWPRKPGRIPTPEERMELIWQPIM